MTDRTSQAAMKKHFVTKFAAALLLSVSQCAGFGRLGHYALGEAISHLVTNRTRDFISTQGYFKAFNDSWGLASVEADNIKRRPVFRWSSRLHFFNSEDDPPLRCVGVQGWNTTKTGNILKGIERFTNLLLSQKGDSFSAILLIHFLQDLIPLHVSGKLRGGNDVTVTYNGHRVILHRLWDSVLVQELADRAGGPDALIEKIVAGAQTRLCAAAHRSMQDDSWMDAVVARADAIERLNCKIVWRDELRTPENLLPVMKGLLIDAAAFSACHWDRIAATVAEKSREDINQDTKLDTMEDTKVTSNRQEDQLIVAVD